LRKAVTDAADWLRSDEHLRNCPRRNRRLAICALLLSAGIAASSAHGIARPFPAEQDLAASQLSLGVVDAMLVYLLLLRFGCRHERRFLGTALAGGLLILLTAFFPGFGGPVATGVNAACLALWLAAAVVSVGFVRLAFNATPSGGGQPATGQRTGEGEAGSRCPVCGASLPGRSVRLASHFRCPACSAELSVRPAYRWQSATFGLVVAGGIATLLGPTRLSFAVVCLAAWLPSTLAVAAIWKRLAPPQPVVHDAGGGGRSRGSGSSEA
jgi:hypothetical protein